MILYCQLSISNIGIVQSRRYKFSVLNYAGIKREKYRCSFAVLKVSKYCRSIAVSKVSLILRPDLAHPYRVTLGIAIPIECRTSTTLDPLANHVGLVYVVGNTFELVFSPACSSTRPELNGRMPDSHSRELRFESIYCRFEALAICIRVHVIRPHRELCVDKAMIVFKRRSSRLQYMPANPTKWGINNVGVL